jgi:uncharacterized protein YjbI with pentapeptide repeats
MSEQDGTKANALQRPLNDDKEAWKVHWKAQDQAWRTEPEIDAKRQEELSKRRAITPDIEQGIYPFKDIKLGRADVEWLLATHENGRGPVDWSDEKQRTREGLDLRGADLRSLNLSRLPLARMLGGLTHKERNSTYHQQRHMSSIHLEDANLSQAHLEKAILARAHLERANLEHAHLELSDLAGSHLEGTTLEKAHLGGTYLRRAFFDMTSLLNGAYLNDKKLGSTLIANVNWNGVNLSKLEWSQVKVLGDEARARQSTDNGKRKGRLRRLDEYEQAVRANRQLAVALQGQGLNEVAVRFAYRAQKLQRVVLRRQKKFGQYLFSGFLDLLAGYGYRPGRTVGWYLIVIGCFAIVYSFFGHLPLLPDSLVFSLMSFHGRGFFPSLSGETSLHNPLVVLAATEAVIGLLIEISFIATFTQRFFGK